MNNNLRQRRILTYRDVLAARSGENGEEMVDVRDFDSTIFARHENYEMQQYTGEHILVRREVAKRLASINAGFQGKYRVKIVFGYRHPEIQKKYFRLERTRIKIENPDATDDELDELTHPLIAVPRVAGHPTGGAVDVALVNRDGERLDMGSPISDFSDPTLLPTFCDGITATQRKNRLTLHDMMVAGGFAPFYGEWWHFSYGDREWAAFYYEKSALYGQINIAH